MPRRLRSIPFALVWLLALACGPPAAEHASGAPDVRVEHAVIAGRVDVLGASSAEPIVILHTRAAPLLVMPNEMHARVADLAGRDVEIAGLLVIESGEPAAVFVTDARAIARHRAPPPHPVAARERAI